MNKPVTAPGLLEAAAGHMRDRAATYDKPEGERSMGATVKAFNAITKRDLSEAEGWLLMQLLKDVRLFQRPGYHADSAEDCVAYAALKAEAKAAEAGSAPAAVPTSVWIPIENFTPLPDPGAQVQLKLDSGGVTEVGQLGNLLDTYHRQIIIAYRVVSS